ncbi:MAG: 16S rRNA (cytidine(1402)-2'-O)-methyltransferase [Acidimicrobiales bacterium]|nr:16S rRNA (cytidine(1402)-2'-O)-methyltransferase [Actinomycetes bacterium]MDG1988988.1 16S rRNA (cytidine(1402)-2'-O)-methyltransferase [Acidimicrobiales bacterium]MDP6160640.1 16S rRNA (cytidine(1402)-2'-O)-methyltransferase [Acidimicrobiales bacterium]MDP6287442.1 16S rRNA (cytidine(1402)-2'-O)-methyltransferase [Acidimicrobiales bacterium]MDP6910440.1 16S rRNA (cytidine(1402)-2'-O)-methyltransferase [Acidimicrobiales bacterium]
MTGRLVPGRLMLVATPIGNLGDLSPRAVEALASADLVACEDTRRTGRLLQHAGITGSDLLRLDDHTEERSAVVVLRRIGEGATVALVSDAGMPGISDPGERVVRRVVDAGHSVVVVPGPSAPVAAVAASGLATDRWCMEGFLPRKGSARSDRLAELAVEERTMVLFESPHRLAATLGEMVRVVGPDRRAVVAREITKLHEEFVRGTVAELAERFAEPPKGEIVLVLEGAPPPSEVGDERIRVVLAEARASGASTRDAADEAARRLGVSRRRAYRLGLES